MIKLFFKIRGGNAPPALPVADPMLYTVLYENVLQDTHKIYFQKSNVNIGKFSTS